MNFLVLLGMLLPVLLFAQEKQKDPLDQAWNNIIQEQQQEECVKGQGPLVLSSEVRPCARRYQFEKQKQEAIPDFDRKWLIP